VIYGTRGADSLSGTDGDDVICGLGGNDSISGLAGSDVLVGGEGHDRVVAGDGDDVVRGGAGQDWIEGDAGDDIVNGDEGRDRLSGGDGNDTIDGGTSHDRIEAGDGDDTVYGGQGNDEVDAGAGNDLLTGDNGRDNLSGGPGDDFLDGGPHRDTLDGGPGTDRCTNGERESGCEANVAPFDPVAEPHPVEGELSAPPTTITIDDAYPGFNLTIDSGGGIYPWDVEVRPARAHMHEILDLVAGPAYDISIPDGGIVNGATLTLPYDVSRLHGPEGEARIWKYDEDRQFWIPAPGDQTVDPVTHTVTTQVQEFSVYAVLGVNTAFGWEQIFQRTPLRCGGGGGGTGVFDVTFVIDTSGSMASSDPTGLRVDGASQFVDAMRPEDQAAVVTFASTATINLGLTSVGTPEGIASVKAAFENGRAATGGTDISAAVATATQVLSASGEGRLRVAILLTDGQSAYDDALTAAAAAAGIEIHTVGLGDGVDAELLQRIATGTGASFRQLSDPAQLPALYRELAGDIIGGPADDDADGIADCVERNGAFTPRKSLFSLLTSPAEFITTDPTDPDSDDDGLLDGQELVAAPLADDPILALHYAFLVDQGLDTYYLLKSDPNDADSDDDGLNDGLEVLNGTDPFGFDPNELGIDGLELAPFTLFQPSIYDQHPAVESGFEFDEDGTVVDVFTYNDDPVVYAGNRECEENCTAIEELAAERGNDNGFGICVSGVGDCTTDGEQERDIVEEARVIQRVFTPDGHLTEIYLKNQAFLLCLLWSSDDDACGDAATDLLFRDDIRAEDLAAAMAQAVRVLPVPGANPDVEIDSTRLARVVEGLLAAGAVLSTVNRTDVEQAVRSCYDSKVLQVINQIIRTDHPCETLPVFSPGGEATMTEFTQHNFDAIAEQPGRMLLTYATDAETIARGIPRRWYIGEPGCTDDDKEAAATRFGVAVSCDEMPYFKTNQAGPGASLRYIPFSHNSAGGARNGAFTTACFPTRGLAAPGPGVGPQAERVPYLVIPRPGGGPTVTWCPVL
jgi:Ca2+-binding RTX toxin-like protein